MTSDDIVVSAASLMARYGEVVALHGVDVSVRRGQVLGVLGANGAGKSTLLRTIGGNIPPAAGQLTVAGHDLTTVAGADAARAVVGYCPDVGGLIRQCTVREHVALSLAFAGGPRNWDAAIDLARQFDLGEVFDRVTEGFSHGMSRRVSVMLAVLAARGVLVLDEPFDGVDPLGVAATLRAVRSAADRGFGVIVSTHLRELLVSACDDIVVMVGGRVVDAGTADAFSGPAGDLRYADLLGLRPADAAAVTG